MKLKQFGIIALLSLPFTVLSHVSSPLLPNFSIFSASPVVAQTSESQKVEADRLLEQGIQQHQTSQFQAAIQSWQQALTIYREIGDRWGEANCLNNLGSAYSSLGQYQQAIDYQQQSLAIGREIGDHQGEAYSLGNLGSAYSSLGQYQQAIDYQQQSLAIKREIGDRQGEANSLNNLGNVYRSLGQYRQAIDYHQQSLAIKREIGDRQGEAYSLNNLGIAYSSLGQYRQAIDYHQQSLAITREIGDRQGEANSLNNLGISYRSLGQYRQAIDYHQQSLAIARELGDRQGEAKSLGNLGSAYRFLGQYQQAIDYHQQSLAIKREIGDRQGEANSLGNLGIAYRNLGQYEQAIDYHQQSLAIARELGDRQGETKSLSHLGVAYSSLGQYQKVIDYQQQSLAIAREIGDHQGEGISLNNLGLALFNSGELTAAETTLIEAMKVYESLRTDLEEDDRKVSIFEKQASTYRTLQQVLVAQNKTNIALEIAERGRARALVELLKQDSSPQSNTPLPLKYPSLKEIKQIARQQDATLVQYSIVSNEQLYIYIIHPRGKIEFRSINLPQETSLEELVTNGQECILDEDKCRSNTNQTLPTIGDWVKLNDDQFEQPWQVVEIQQNTLTLRLESWEQGTTIQRPITDVVAIVNAFNRQRLQKLHQLLIQPIADLLPKNENGRVIFIPHEQLFLVPFPALQDETSNYLIEKHTILTAPSIEVLGLTREKRQNLPDSVRDALVVGNPTSDLPHAKTEAIEIARLLNTIALTGNSATKAAILPKLPQARIIHLATHGLLGDFKGLGVPGAIALAPSGTGELNDGLLTAGELLQMKLNAELVVLSACKTGQGEITSDGVIGLSRSLVAAGVPSIIVSLWSVPDAPTADLMTRFYQHLDNTNNKAQALRQAMLNTMAEHPNPKDWAAFTLIGEVF